MNTWIRTLAATGLLAAAVPVAADEYLRCGTQLVEHGDSEYTVLQKCGKPAAVDGYRWIYDQGEGQLIKIVIFSTGGTVERIEVGDRQ